MTKDMIGPYLARIGYHGEVKPDLQTLKAMHRAHVLSIPYENLDIHLGAATTTSPQEAYAKIVERGRGGWCFEMNGLLGLMLSEIGFRVTRLAGGVGRADRGDAMVGNHLVLRVDLDEPWIADAGFGDGLIEPVPLRKHSFDVGPFACSLEDLGGGWWRYHNDPRGSAPNFDFHEAGEDEELLSTRCNFLQSDPNSNFVLNTVVQKWRSDSHISLRGKVLTETSASGQRKHQCETPEEYMSILNSNFDLDIPQAAKIWPAICRRHDAVFGGAN